MWAEYIYGVGSGVGIFLSGQTHYADDGSQSALNSLDLTLRCHSLRLSGSHPYRSSFYSCLCINYLFYVVSLDTLLNIYLYNISFKASRGAGVQALECKRGSSWVRFSFQEIKYLMFSLSRSGNEAKRDDGKWGTKVS